MMLQTQNITLPSMMPIDLSNLEAFHIYDAIENELKDAMTVSYEKVLFS